VTCLHVSLRADASKATLHMHGESWKMMALFAMAELCLVELEPGMAQMREQMQAPASDDAPCGCSMQFY
jgi:hypothetical protein